ncbi:hypothetical protein L9F63_023184 [Diploptera punctata]|uniref:G-protein coupled receptors family 1 profile domain-containing protein n=1 Tax=Diploptera punctata TaxID=6984 RepID=A0AAD7ZJD0_DIPPU|nr:hypothetical protein L9F63_023184 [Diploptera punctata]
MLNSTSAQSDQMHLIHSLSLAVYVVIIAVGCIWNGTLIFMFARHKEIRTKANTMIFNLAVCDIINLGIVAPLRYQYHYPHASPDNVNACRCIAAFHHTILYATAFSVFALSIQRFCITLPSPIINTKLLNNTTFAKSVYISLIWAISLINSLPYGLIWEVYGYLCDTSENGYVTKAMIIARFVIFCVILPFFMFFFNFATARRLKCSVRIVVGGVNNTTREVVRVRSANVVMVLSILFLMTHLPYFSWCLYAYWTDVDRNNATTLILEYVSKHFLFLNSMFNPMALYITSSTFRKLFRKYLCCSRGDRKIPSVQSTSTSF